MGGYGDKWIGEKMNERWMNGINVLMNDLWVNGLTDR